MVRQISAVSPNCGKKNTPTSSAILRGLTRGLAHPWIWSSCLVLLLKWLDPDQTPTHACPPRCDQRWRSTEFFGYSIAETQITRHVFLIPASTLGARVQIVHKGRWENYVCEWWDSLRPKHRICAPWYTAAGVLVLQWPSRTMHGKGMMWFPKRTRRTTKTQHLCVLFGNHRTQKAFQQRLKKSRTFEKSLVLR